MSELDEAWELALAEAKRRAHAAGRADIAQYLALRAQNDLLRRTAIDWLVDTLTAFAADANRRGAAIQIELSDAHQFRVGPATMVGTKLTLRHGVRALSIETGWPAPTSNILAGRAKTRSCCWRAHQAAHRSGSSLKKTTRDRCSPKPTLALTSQF